MPNYVLPSGQIFTFPNTTPYAPDPDDVVAALIYFLKTYIQPEQFNGASVLKTITDGECRDFPQNCPFCSVMIQTAPTTRREFGGGVENGLHFDLVFMGDATDATLAEQWVRRIYKLAVELFSSQAVLQGTNGSNSTYDARIVDDSPKFGSLAQGVPFPLRAFAMEIVVLQSWRVAQGIQQ